jgi:hypothetical protein
MAHSPAPLLPSLPLATLLQPARRGERIGAWVRGIGRRVRLGWVPRVGVRLAISADLGALLRRCDRIAVRQGLAPVLLPAEELIGLRVLEVVLGLPYLPAAERLLALYPGLRVHEGVLALPIGPDSPEEALGACAAGRIPVVASRIRYVAMQR